MKKRNFHDLALQAANAIAGGLPVSWLQPGLERAVREILAPALTNDELIPRRSKVAKEVEIIVAATENLSSRLGGRSVAGVLVAGGGPGNGMEDDTELLDLLSGLKLRAKQTLRRLKRPGRGGTKPAIAPETVCATITIIAWHMTRKTFPPAGSDAACQVAETLWKMASGAASTYKYSESSTGRWRPHLSKALVDNPPPSLHLLRSHIWAKIDAPSP